MPDNDMLLGLGAGTEDKRVSIKDILKLFFAPKTSNKNNPFWR